jgi:ribosomal protein S1
MHEEMEFEGIIRSVKPYGAFADVGNSVFFSFSAGDNRYWR